MGLEVTVLVVLLSWCSYMTEEREKDRERGGGWDGGRGVVGEKEREKMEGRQEETEVTGRCRRIGMKDRE